MEDETDTPMDNIGTDNVEPSVTDNPDSIFDYHDPDEDNEEAEEANGTDDETVEAEAADETEEAEEDEGQETEDEPEQAAFSDDTEVELSDGTKQTVKELKDGYLRQSDYTRKAQEVANQRRTTEGEAQRIAAISEAFVDHIAKMMPNEPAPHLAQTNPAEYTRQKAAFDAAVAQLEKIIEVGNTAKETTQKFSQEDHQRTLQAEGQKLAEMFPETARPDKRQAFFGEVMEAATSLGYSDEELARVTDHRLIAMAHWAKRGMDAERAKEKAKAKVKDAPPAAPRKPGQTASKASKNRKAMQKARSTGRLDDVLAVDFDF